MNVPASSDTTGAVDAGQLIVGFLKQIGIKVNLQPATDSKMNDYWDSGNFDAYIWYWSGDPDPNYQLFVFTSEQCGAWEDGCWKNPEFDKLYEEQRKQMDQDARQKRGPAGAAGRVRRHPRRRARLSRTGSRPTATTGSPGWTPSPGPNGYLLPTYNYDTLLSAKPVEGSTMNRSSSACRGGSGLVGIVIAAIVVVVVRRGRRVDPDEA